MTEDGLYQFLPGEEISSVFLKANYDQTTIYPKNPSYLETLDARKS